MSPFEPAEFTGLRLRSSAIVASAKRAVQFAWAIVRPSLLLSLVCLVQVQQAKAEDCNTSCGDQCRVKLEPIDACAFGGCVTVVPGVEFIEPSCQLKCEAVKKASCVIGAPLSTIPGTPLEQIKFGANLACTLPQQVVLHVVASRCGFGSSAQSASDSALVNQAKQILIDAGLLSSNDFIGVGIYFCDAVAGEGGIAPDRDLVYLHSRWRDAASSPYKLTQFAALIAHEMKHVAQYRDWGTDKFKCDYARQYADCGGCQDNRHSIEQSAYATGDAALGLLSASLPPNVERMFLDGPGGLDMDHAVRVVLPFSRRRSAPSDVEYEWFKFTSPSSGQVEVRLSGAKIRFLGRLERTGHPRVGEGMIGPSDSNGVEFLGAVTAGDTYYVGIQKYDSGSSGIQLDVSFVPKQ